MSDRHILDRRNRLFVLILWVSIGLSVLTNLMVGATGTMLVVLIAFGAAGCGAATLLTYRRIAIEYIMYLVPVIMTGLILMLLLSDPQPLFSTYLLIYINMGMMTLYSNYRPVLFTAILSFILTIYAFYDPRLHDAIFAEEPLIYLMLYIVLGAITLCASTLFSERLQRQVMANSEAVQRANEQAGKLLHEIMSSVTILNAFSTDQKERAVMTRNISKEVTHACVEISSTIKQETNELQGIRASVQAVDQSIGEMMQQMEEVSIILAKLQRQMNNAANPMGWNGKSGVPNAVDERTVNSIMMEFMNSTDQVNEQADQMRIAIAHLEEQYRVVAKAMVAIATSKEQHMTAVEEVVGSMELQHNQITQLVQSYDRLDRRVSDLKKLAQAYDHSDVRGVQ